MGSVCSKDPPSFDKDQRNWAQSQRVDDKINDERGKVWTNEHRSEAVARCFHAIATTDADEGAGADAHADAAAAAASSMSSPGAAKAGEPYITLGKLGGIVRDALGNLGECYCSPSQNKNLLRIHKPPASAGSTRQLNKKYPPPPDDARWVKSLRDLTPVLGPWCDGHRADPVPEHRFGLAMELVLWQANHSVFTKVLGAAKDTAEDDTPTPRRAAPPPLAFEQQDEEEGIQGWSPMVVGEEGGGDTEHDDDDDDGGGGGDGAAGGDGKQDSDVDGGDGDGDGDGGAGESKAGGDGDAGGANSGGGGGKSEGKGDAEPADSGGKASEGDGGTGVGGGADGSSGSKAPASDPKVLVIAAEDTSAADNKDMPVMPGTPTRASAGGSGDTDS